MSTRRSKRHATGGDDGGDGGGAAGVGSPSPAAVGPSPSRPSRHRREWTHSLDSGMKEQRIHRRPRQPSIHEKVTEQTTRGEVQAAAGAVEDADPSAAAAAGESADPADPQQLSEADGDVEDADDANESNVDMADGGMLESDPMEAEDAAAAAADAAAESALSDPSSLPSLLASYRATAGTAPFEFFAQVVGVIRSSLVGGVTHVDELVFVGAPSGSSEEESVDPATASPTSRVRIQTDLRATLHEVRVAFARAYPLPYTTWMEWIEDVQTSGSGLAVPDLVGGPSAAAESAEEAEAAQDAAGMDEQHFLLSLFRVALCDYASPQLWDAFLSYVSATADRLLAREPVRRSFRRLIAQAIWPRGWREERKRRASEKKKRQHALKEATAGDQKKKKAKKTKADEDEEEDKDEEDEESEEEEDDDDDEDEDEWSDDEEDESADQIAATAVPNPFAALHPSLHALLPLPYASASPASGSPSDLPAVVPIGYAFADGDSVFQKVRSIEMKVLTGMMRRLQQQQQRAENDDDEDEDAPDEPEIDQDAIEDQMDRISRLYRIQLGVPMSDLESVHHSFADWLAKQGGTIADETELQTAYDDALQTAQMLEKKFETAWSSLIASGTMQSSVGVLSADASSLAHRYLDFLTTAGKAKKRCSDNPCLLFSVLERVLAFAFLEPAWWLRYIGLLQTYGGSHVECARLRLEVAWRAHRNCPWDIAIVRAYFRALEEIEPHAVDVSRAVVEEAFGRVLANPALQANAEAMIESQLLIIDYYRRTLLVSSTSGAAAPSVHGAATPASVSRDDALLIRSYFHAIRALLPYVAHTNASLPSRVYEYWVDLESRYLHVHQGVHTDDATAQADEAESAEYAARKDGISVATWRARQLWSDATTTLGHLSAQPWLNWIALESRALDTTTGAESHALVTFIRGLFRSGIDAIMSPTSDAAATALSTLEPLLDRWTHFERMHATTLAEVHSAERRVEKYLQAIKDMRAAEAQQQQAAAWQQSQDGAAASSESDDAPTWLTKTLEPKSSKPPKSEKKSSKKPPPAEKKTKHAKNPADATAAPVETNAKKRKRDDEEEAKTSVKKGKEDAAAVSAAIDASSAVAVAAPPALAVPPHTLFICNLSWTMRESDHRALLAPYGTISRLVNHRGSKVVKRAYVEVTYAAESEAAQAESALHGKELSGKKLSVTRAPPSSSSGDASKPSEDEADPLSVFVKNLPRDRPDIEQLVRDFFDERCGAGAVAAVDIPRITNKTGAAAAATSAAGTDDTSAAAAPAFRNFGTVYFKSADLVPTAFTLHLHPLLDQLVAVVPNTAPSRLRRAADEAKKKATMTRKATAFQPRATLVKNAANAKPSASNQANANTVAAAADDTKEAAPIASNEEFRARFLGAAK